MHPCFQTATIENSHGDRLAPLFQGEKAVLGMVIGRERILIGPTSAHVKWEMDREDAKGLILALAEGLGLAVEISDCPRARRGLLSVSSDCAKPITVDFAGA